jgi:hypothetical protein
MAMGIQVAWLDDKQRIIVYTFANKWKWDELFAAIETCHRMMDTVDYPVRTIFDVSRMVGWVENPIANMKRANEFYHPRSSTVALVGVSRILRSIVTLFQRFTRFSNPNGVHFFNTLPEAVDFLNIEIANEVVRSESPA